MHHPCPQVITSSAWRSSRDCQGLSLGAPAVGLQQMEAVTLAQLLPRAESPLHRPPMSSLPQLLSRADSALHSLLRSSLQQVLQWATRLRHSQRNSNFLQPPQRAASALLLSLHRAGSTLCSQWAPPMGNASQGQAIQKAPASAQPALQAQHKLLFPHNLKHIPWTTLQEGGRLAALATADRLTRSAC